jgi:hypothetical protein
MSVLGSAADILERVKRLLPTSWFSYVAPYRDAIIGGAGDLAAWSYSLVAYARTQSRLATASGIWLDILSYDFLGRFLPRTTTSDDIYRVTIRATILQERVTRAGMLNALLTLTGNQPVIFEPWNTYDTGAYSGLGMGGDGIKYGSMGYGVGRGGYGNMQLPAQTFLKVFRGASSGVPNVEGYGDPVAGYGVGAGEYTGPLIALDGITNEMIYRVINITKPTGTFCWVAIGAQPVPVRRPCIFNSPNAKADSQNLAII